MTYRIHKVQWARTINRFVQGSGLFFTSNRSTSSRHIRKKSLCSLLLLLFFGSASFFVPTSAGGAILDFSGLGPNGAAIPQDYGDIPNLDVSYRELLDFGDADEAPGGNVAYWDTGYNGLVGVAYGTDRSPSSTAEITFSPSPGYAVSLDNFDLGFWLDRIYTSQVKVYNEDYTQLLFESDVLTGGFGSININLDIFLDEDLHLQWKNSLFASVDNVAYRAAVVPIPGSLWVLL